MKRTFDLSFVSHKTIFIFVQLEYWTSSTWTFTYVYFIQMTGSYELVRGQPTHHLTRRGHEDSKVRISKCKKKTSKDDQVWQKEKDNIRSDICTTGELRNTKFIILYCSLAPRGSHTHQLSSPCTAFSLSHSGSFLLNSFRCYSDSKWEN